MKKIILLISLALSQFISHACSCNPNGEYDFQSTISIYSQEYLVVFDSVERYESDINESINKDLGHFKIISVVKDNDGFEVGDSLIIEGGMGSLCQRNVNFEKNDTLLVSVNGGGSSNYYLNNCRESFLQVKKGMIDGENITDILARMNVINATNKYEATQHLAVYPLPTSDVLNVNSPSSPITNIELFDMNGISVLNLTKSATHQISISLETLIEGVYTLKVRTEGGNIINKRVFKL